MADPVFSDYPTPSETGTPQFEPDARTDLANNKTAFETINTEIVTARDGELTLKARIEGIGSGDNKAKVSATDNTADYLGVKIIGGTNVNVSTVDDKVKIDVTDTGSITGSLLPPPIISGPILVVEQDSVQLTIENYDSTCSYDLTMDPDFSGITQTANKINFVMPNVQDMTNYALQVKVIKTDFTSTWGIHNILSLPLAIATDPDNAIQYSGMLFYKDIEFGSYLAKSEDSFIHASAEPQGIDEKAFANAQVTCDIENKEGMSISGTGPYTISSETNLLKLGDRLLVYDTITSKAISTTLSSCTATSATKPAEATLTPSRTKGRGISFFLDANAYWDTTHEGKYIIHKDKGKAVISNCNKYTDTVNEVLGGTITIYESPNYIDFAATINTQKIHYVGMYIRATSNSGLAKITGTYPDDTTFFDKVAVVYLEAFTVGHLGILTAGNYEIISSMCTCNIIEEFEDINPIAAADWYLGPIENTVTFDETFLNPTLAFTNNNVVTICENKERDTSLPMEEISLSHIHHTSNPTDKIYCGTKENCNIFQGNSKIIAYVNEVRTILNYTSVTEQTLNPSADLKIWKEDGTIPVRNIFTDITTDQLGAYYLAETFTLSPGSFNFTVDHIGAFIYETSGPGLAQITHFDDITDPYSMTDEQCRITIFEEFSDVDMEFAAGEWGIKWYEITLEIDQTPYIPIAAALVPFSYDIDMISSTTTNITGYLPASGLLSDSDTVTITVDGEKIEDVVISNLVITQRNYDDKTMLLLRSDTTTPGDPWTNLANNSYVVDQLGAGNVHSTSIGGGKYLIDDTTKFGDSSFAFPGDGATDTWAVINTDGDEYFNFNDDDWTIDFWYKYKSYPTDKEFITIKSGSSSSFFIEIRHSEGYFRVASRIQNALDYIDYSWRAIYPSSSVYDEEGWMHIALVKSTNEMKFYLNGAHVQHGRSTTPFKSYKKENLVPKYPEQWMWTEDDGNDTDTDLTNQSCVIIGCDRTLTPINRPNFYLQEFRISKTARWYNEFIPPNYFHKHYEYSFDIEAQTTAPTACTFDPYQDISESSINFKKTETYFKEATLETKDPESHIKVVYYTGNASTQSITGVGFKPDVVLIKDLGTSNIALTATDVINGTGFCYGISAASTPTTDANLITNFDSDGFSLGNAAKLNTNAVNYVALCFKANEIGVHTSYNAERYNKRCGFSIIQYTGNGSKNHEIEHSLGVKPELIMVTRVDGNTNAAISSLKTDVDPLGYFTCNGHIPSYKRYQGYFLDGISDTSIKLNSLTYNTNTFIYTMILFADVPGCQMTFDHPSTYYETTNANNQMPWELSKFRQYGCIETGLDHPDYIWGFCQTTGFYDKDYDPGTPTKYFRFYNTFGNIWTTTAGSGYYWTGRGIEAYGASNFNNTYANFGLAFKKTSETSYKLSATSTKEPLSQAKTISAGISMNKGEKITDFVLNLEKEQ